MNKTIIAAVVFLLILLSAFLAYRRNDKSPPKFYDLSGGAKIQRQRIDRVTETARILDIDKAIESLSQYSESFELALLSGLSPASKGKVMMNCMRGDRRVLKIFEHLLSLPSKEADAKSREIFEMHFSTLHRSWLDLMPNGGLPKTGPPHHAASAGLLFCSFFCSPELLDAEIKRWDEILGSPEFRKNDVGSIPTPAKLLDPLFRLNLLVISGQRKGRSVTRLNEDLEAVCQKITGDVKPFLQASQMTMFKWSAETLNTDFTHVTRGVPASGNSAILVLPGFADHDSVFNLWDRDVASLCENCIRTWRDR